MKVLFYHSSAFLAHHMGVLLDEATLMVRNGHEVHFATCDAAIDICFGNCRGNKAQCRLCKWSTHHALSCLPSQVHRVSLCNYKSEIDHSKDLFTYSSIRDIKDIEYKGVKIGYSVLSAYITATRNNDPIFDGTFKKYMDKLLRTSFTLTDSIEKLYSEIQPDRVCIFNGRFYELRPAYEIAVNRGIDLCCYEVTIGEKDEFYKVHFDNVIPHSISENLRKIDKQWNDPAIPSEMKEQIGKSFFENRRGGKPAGDTIYTKHQEVGILPVGWDSTKRNFTIFNSSEDEFMAIGDEYDRLMMFSSQIEGIKKVLSLCALDDSIHVYLRVHPNLTGIQYSYHTDLYKLEQEFSNVTVVPCDSNVSSYTLMDYSEKVIVFGSTMGIESVYWNKPVILLGASLYHSVDICYTTKDIGELQKLLLADLVVKDNSWTIKYGFFVMYHNERDKYDSVNFNYTYWNIGNRKIPMPNFQKIFGSQKLYTLAQALMHKLYKLAWTTEDIDLPVRGR